MIYLIYTLLLIGFLGISALILRYLVKFGHLAPRFKWVVMIFATLALVIIIFSIYLLTQLDKNPSSTGSKTTINTNTNTSSSVNDLNF